MQHITGISGQQLRMSSLEDTILQDNPVRFIDAFVGSINLASRKSKRRTQFNHASVQHQTRHEYSGCARFTCQTQDLELTLQAKGLVFNKSNLFKAYSNTFYFWNKPKHLKI
jgi:hypothetical protein